MSFMDEIISKLGDQWIARIYAEQVRPLRTRSFEMEIPERLNRPEIHHTLLGIDLKIGKRRINCPDLATARYLRVFARIGCRKVAVPYDITKISALADKLDSGWHRMFLLADAAASSQQAAARCRSTLIGMLRDEITNVGPGKKMPEFERPAGRR